MAFISGLPITSGTRHNATAASSWSSSACCHVRRTTFTAGGAGIARIAATPREQEGAPSGRHAARATPQCSDMGVEFPTAKYDETFRIGVISTRWNAELVTPMVAAVEATLTGEAGVEAGDVVKMEVPGAWELPMAARLMCAAQKVDAVVCLGVLIKGESQHYEFLASAVSSGLMDLQLTTSIPVVFGVLCCTERAQAEARSTGDKSCAADWARTAMEMANLRKVQTGGVSAGKKSVGFF